MTMSKVRRLASHFRPEGYRLRLQLDPADERFSGQVSIIGQKLGRPSSRLVFHQSGLKIDSAKVTKRDRSGESEIVLSRINYHHRFQEVRFHSARPMAAGAYKIDISFSGIVSRGMDGIYICRHGAGDNSKKIIATQFESHHARQAFPCIDEPEAKAVFELTLETPTGLAVISNTPRLEASHQSGRLVTSFEPTPKMSTYLLAFVVGELAYKQTMSRKKVLIRAYATKPNHRFTDFALRVASECLDFYSDYFGIDYPLAKCDLVALPDFASGAMENWGCVTFREQALLVDPQNTGLATKQHVALVVAHELTHQWFGNLVTMRWWTDLWLNEGFASWMEYLAIDHLFPDWQLWTQFALEEQQQALKLDALANSHPVEVAINHPDEIRAIFDAISYSKGASVIHMLERYLGADAFRGGLRRYLKTHAYGNTTTSDLWQSLEEATGKPVSSFMAAWTQRAGFPLLCPSEKPPFAVCQQRFLMSGATEKPPGAEPWPVPLLNPALPLPILDKKSASLPMPSGASLKLNQGQAGFYRVAYPPGQLKALGAAVAAGQLEPLDRLGLLADLTETCKAGHQPTTAVLEFMDNFINEDNYAVWDSLATALGAIRLVMDNDQLRARLKPYIRQLVTRQRRRLGWQRRPGESHFDQLLRPLILGLAASADEPAVVKKCWQMFGAVTDVEDVAADLRAAPSAKNIKRGIDIDPDLRGIVFGTVARLGGRSEFGKLLKLYDTAHLSEEKVTLAAALTGFRQPAQIKRALALITSQRVRLQDAAYWIAYSFLNRHARLATWDWLADNWTWLQSRLGSDLAFYRLPIYAARGFSQADFKRRYKDFFEPRLTPALERSYRQGLEIISWQSDWRRRDLKSLVAYLARRGF